MPEMYDETKTYNELCQDPKASPLARETALLREMAATLRENERLRTAYDELESTTQPGKNFGAFNLPMSRKELLWQLVNGTPCEIPSICLGSVMEQIQAWTIKANIKVEADKKIAQLTPIDVVLNDIGRLLLRR
jgi:hypothetical protein